MLMRLGTWNSCVPSSFDGLEGKITASVGSKFYHLYPNQGASIYKNDEKGRASEGGETCLATVARMRV